MKKILIIEDDDNLLKIYKDKISTAGFEVITTKHGAEGLDIVKTQVIDLILLDIILPNGINGFDVLESIKKNEDTKQIPVIVLTNLDSEKKVAMEIGAADYIVKSNANLDDIVKKIKDLTR